MKQRKQYTARKMAWGLALIGILAGMWPAVAQEPVPKPSPDPSSEPEVEEAPGSPADQKEGQQKEGQQGGKPGEEPGEEPEALDRGLSLGRPVGLQTGSAREHRLLPMWNPGGEHSVLFLSQARVENGLLGTLLHEIPVDELAAMQSMKNRLPDGKEGFFLAREILTGGAILDWTKARGSSRGNLLAWVNAYPEKLYDGLLQIEALVSWRPGQGPIRLQQKLPDVGISRSTWSVAMVEPPAKKTSRAKGSDQPLLLFPCWRFLPDSRSCLTLAWVQGDESGWIELERPEKGPIEVLEGGVPAVSLRMQSGFDARHRPIAVGVVDDGESVFHFGMELGTKTKRVRLQPLDVPTGIDWSVVADANNQVRKSGADEFFLMGPLPGFFGTSRRGDWSLRAFSGGAKGSLASIACELDTKNLHGGGDMPTTLGQLETMHLARSKAGSLLAVATAYEYVWTKQLCVVGFGGTQSTLTARTRRFAPLDKIAFNARGSLLCPVEDGEYVLLSASIPPVDSSLGDPPELGSLSLVNLRRTTIGPNAGLNPSGIRNISADRFLPLKAMRVH